MEMLQKQLNNYIYEERNIGGGQFSEVFLGFEIYTKEKVAIKQIDCSRMRDQVMMQMMKNEIGILKIIPKQQNILKFYDVFQNNQLVYIITEYCNQGDLQQFIRKHQITEDLAIDLITHVLNGLQHCKNNYIIHRDIKPANIFMSNGIPKLADFGFALCKNVQNGVEIQNYNVGTPMYMAPETLLNNHYSFKSDLWSAGVVLYEMVFGQQPFRSQTEPELVQKLRVYQQNGLLYYPFQCSRFLDILIQNMLQCDKQLRWSVEQCLDYLRQRTQQRMVTSQKYIAQQSQHVRSVTPIQIVQQQQQQQQQSQQQKSILPIQYQQQFKIQQYPIQVNTSQQLSQLPIQKQLIPQQQYLHFSNPSPHSSRENQQPVNAIKKTQESSYLPMRFPSVQRERNTTLQDDSQRSNVEPNQQNQYSQQFGNLMYKIAKLFINTQYFEQFSLGKMYTRSECMFLQLKIQFCLLQCCIQIFSHSNPCLPECQVRLLNVRQTILQMPDQYKEDPRFMSLFNNNWVLENIFEQMREYIYAAIHLINDYLNKDCSNPQLIIILDYLVILQQLLKRFVACSTWMEFDKRNNIAAIVQAPINPNPNQFQWMKISNIIQKDIVK
ncbi:unnamed protein product [Paramecium octaurelia]|uniref:Protein kinase domain-containing protein n=1 Tax=Paramecium octaurelia TaxID=43137 RepID=A0A8S1TEI2_PAROT|nr:unnamed protein product [Paramecium octaurelia]